MLEKQLDPMMIHCLSEVGRLSNQDYYKADEAVAEDLARALMRCSDSPEHATAIISAWKQATRKMLHESDIPAVADQTANRGIVPPHAASCPLCPRPEDTLTKTVRGDFLTVEKNGYSGVDWCACPRGEALRKLDKLRRASQASIALEVARDLVREHGNPAGLLDDILSCE